MTLLETFIELQASLKRSVRAIVAHDDVEDIVQETFVKGLEAQQHTSIEYQKTYMLKTARNLALNHIARHSNSKQSSLDASELNPSAGQHHSPEEQWQSKVRLQRFHDATQALSPEVRRVFIMKKVMGQSQKDIAKALGISESTVEKHVSKGLMHCAKWLKEGELKPVRTSQPVTATPLLQQKAR